MSRAVAGRLRLTGRLVAKTALHVGGAHAELEADMTPVIDGSGRYVVPGTSLAGALRAYAEQAGLARELWGGSAEGEAASLAIVHDVVLELPAKAGPHLRHGVGIDRRTGAAAPQIKYERAVLPPGTAGTLELLVELPPDTTRAAELRRAASALCVAMQEKHVQVGAGQTRGLGVIVLEDPRLQEQDLSSFDGVLGAVGGEWSGIDVEPGASTPARALIEIAWSPVGALLCGDGRDRAMVKALPLTSRVAEELDKVALVVPGSSLKGALRAHAERIVRSLRGLHVARDEPFRDQMRVPLVDELFGSTDARGALDVHDTHSRTTFDAQRWAQVLEEADTRQDPEDPCRLARALDHAAEGTGALLSVAHHVALDRWTGGAAESLLFSEIEARRVEWHPLELTLDLARISTAALSLLLLVLRDFAAGLIALGAASGRGHGWISVSRIAITGGAGHGLPSAPLDLDGDVDAAWAAWLGDALNDHVAAWDDWMAAA